MRGSVFKMKFRVLSIEFESIETSPGFAQLLGEIGIKINNQDHVLKNLSNDKSSEVYLLISQKKLSCTIFDKKNDKKRNERKS